MTSNQQRADDQWRELGQDEVIKKGDELDDIEMPSGWVLVDESIGSKVSMWRRYKFRRRVSQPAATCPRCDQLERVLDETGVASGDEHHKYSHAERIRHLGIQKEYAWTQLDEARAKIAQLERDKAEFIQGLKPFAEAAHQATKFFHPHAPELRDSLPIKTTLGDCRHAATLIARRGKEGV